MLQFYRRFKILKGIKIALLVQKYGNFGEGVDFAYCGSCIGKGLHLQPAQQACYLIFKPCCLHLKQTKL